MNDESNSSFIIHHSSLVFHHSAYGVAVVIAEGVQVGAVGQAGRVESKFVFTFVQLDFFAVQLLAKQVEYLELEGAGFGVLRFDDRLAGRRIGNGASAAERGIKVRTG